MTKTAEELNKRRIVMADGRYLIFYTFGANDRFDSSHPEVPTPEVEADKPTEET